MMLRYSFALTREADALEASIAAVLESGTRTGDIMAPGCQQVGTAEMGDAVAAEFKRRLAA
jgi:3-isopropylmalate dehydrogenase